MLIFWKNEWKIDSENVRNSLFNSKNHKFFTSFFFSKIHEHFFFTILKKFHILHHKNDNQKFERKLLQA